METHIIELPGGRELAYAEAGDAAGTPVIAFHGTPGSRRQILLPLAVAAAERTGARLIAPDRPGYGHSSFVPHRRLADWPADVTALADHLGLDRFAVLGVSGGGPHALACAAMLAGRVTRAAIVSGVGPIAGPADTDGMMRSNQLLSALARRSERAALPLTGLMTAVARHRPEQAMRSMAKQLPASDVAVLERPEILAAFVAEARSASATTAAAAAQDMSIFARPWGVELSAIRLPVDFWQGDADRNVPPAHAVRQSALVEGSTVHHLAGEGHFLVIDHLEEILRTVVG